MPESSDPVIEPSHVDGRTFDWIPRFDPRSRLFSISAKISPPPEPIPPRTWAVPVNLDQGPDGACVGFGHTHRYAAEPTLGTVSNEAAFELYHLAQTLDDWPGESYSGSSVLAGVKAAQQKGWLGAEYLWAFGERELAWGIYTTGPAVIGVPWRQGMMNPSPTGTIEPTGESVGGHCVCVFAYVTAWPFETGPENGYLIWNSWGSGWGRGGWAAIRARHMAELIEDQWAETCLPTPVGTPPS